MGFGFITRNLFDHITKGWKTENTCKTTTQLLEHVSTTFKLPLFRPFASTECSKTDQRDDKVRRLSRNITQWRTREKGMAISPSSSHVVIDNKKIVEAQGGEKPVRRQYPGCSGDSSGIGTLSHPCYCDQARYPA